MTKFMFAAAAALLLAGCSNEVQRVEVTNFPHVARGEPMYQPIPESRVELAMTFECSQAWRFAKSKGYGESYLSDACRTQLEQARGAK